MPQLNPAPWLAYLLLSWTVFAVLVLPKVTMHTFTENPTPLLKQKANTKPWDWPWQ